MRISLIHVGDIHYPVNRAAQMADLKDKGLSSDFVAAIAPLRLKSAMDALIRVIESNTDVRGLMFSGDLTSISDMSGYDECVAYLEENLSGKPVWDEQQLHVVHGNHDVERDADTSLDPLARYRRTQEAWESRKLPILRADQVRSVEVRAGKGAVTVHSMNSCVGCGEIRRVPEKVRKQIGMALKKLKKRPISEDVFKIVGEQLDTPAFDVEHLQEAVSRIADRRDSVHVLLGHHPLLPQAIPRVEVYTEVINGGHMRGALTGLPDGVLYCHGHVHDDPIEVVRDVDFDTDVTFVSAPLFVDGFNLLTFHYATDQRSTNNPAVPIGCEVVRYRTGRQGTLRPEAPVRLSLCRADTFDFIATDMHRRILKNLTSEPVRFRPLLVNLRSEFGTIYPARLAEHLAHLHWYRLVDITGRNEEADHWQIRRLGG